MNIHIRHRNFAVVAAAAVLAFGLASCKEDMKRLAVFHETHEEQELTCDICHEEVDLSEMTATAPSAAETCEVCHAGTAPPTHDAAWTELHGEESGYGAGMCSYCHESNDCDMCHQITEPKNHNTFWRKRGHGLEADWDRSKCMVCHQEDFCIRCHNDTEPSSHTALWAGSRNSHCLSCHFPVGDNSNCAVCHGGVDVLDTHLFPLSPAEWHTPGSDCEECHNPASGLTHFSTTENCELCHMI